jgi:hypothetical protein
LGTQDRYAERVPKQRYSPPTDEVAAKIEAAVEVFQRWQDSEAEYKQMVAELIDQDGQWKVPVAHMAERLGLERKTVYRHAGRSMT